MYVSHILLTFFFPTLPIKLKLGLHIGGRQLLANHVHGAIYGLFRGSRALKVVQFLKVALVL